MEQTAYLTQNYAPNALLYKGNQYYNKKPYIAIDKYYLLGRCNI